MTDFSAYSHDALLQMLSAGDVRSVRSAADYWRQVGRSLSERGDAVQAELLRFSPQWRGGAADQYKIMMAEFVESVDGVAEIVASVRDLVYSASDALARAQQEMPAAVAVPALGDVATVVAGGPSSAANTLWQRLSDDQQVAVTDQLRHHRACSEAAGGATSRAVAIMTELAGHYLDVAYAMPKLPVAAQPPTVPTDTAAATVVATSLDTTGAPFAPLPLVDGVVPIAVDAQKSPLFGDMYAAGTLAASAAVLGRFRLGSSWLKKRRQDKATPETPEPDSAPTDSAPMGGGGSGAGVIGATAAEPPKANPVLAGGVIGAGAATAAPGLVAPGSFATTGAGTGSGMGMMPPMGGMPMGGGGEGGGGGGRRPPWLVEIEPVFGEDVAVTPAVIGAEAMDPRTRRPMV